MEGDISCNDAVRDRPGPAGFPWKRGGMITQTTFRINYAKRTTREAQVRAPVVPLSGVFRWDAGRFASYRHGNENPVVGVCTSNLSRVESLLWIKFYG